MSTTWGGPQTFAGPVLSVPYLYTLAEGSGRRQATAYAHLLPRDLQVDAKLVTERRRRGIFEVVVYRARAHRQGPLPAMRRSTGCVRRRPRRLERCHSQRGLVGPTRPQPHAVCSRGTDARRPSPAAFRTSGFSATASTRGSPAQSRTGRGNGDAVFVHPRHQWHARHSVPAGRGRNGDHLQSGWPHPSFMGGRLPEQWEGTNAGFTARWHVPDFGRPYPGQWSSVEMNAQRCPSGPARQRSASR